MRILLLFAFACGGSGGGGGASQKPTETAKPPSTSSNDACTSAYADYEERWGAARSEELREIDFDDEAIAEVVSIEVAILPTKDDVAKLRDQYGAVAAFIPDAPWPVALDAAAAAIEACGEEAPRPT